MSIKKIGSFIGHTVLTLATVSAVVVGTGLMRDAMAKPAKPQQPDFFSVFKANYPHESMMMTGDIAQADILGRRVQDVTNEHVVAWRKKYGPAMALASDETVTNVLTNYVDMLKLVRDSGSPELCNDVLANGTVVLSQALNEMNGLYGIMEGQLIAMIEALASGRDEPTKRKPVSDRDSELMYAAMVQLGGSVETLEIIVAADVQDPRLCSATIMMIEAMLSDDSAALDRVRADYAMGLTVS